jgi:hypothetical protein
LGKSPRHLIFTRILEMDLNGMITIYHYPQAPMMGIRHGSTEIAELLGKCQQSARFKCPVALPCSVRIRPRDLTNMNFERTILEGSGYNNPLFKSGGLLLIDDASPNSFPRNNRLSASDAVFIGHLKASHRAIWSISANNHHH